MLAQCPRRRQWQWLVTFASAQNFKLAQQLFQQLGKCIIIDNFRAVVQMKFPADGQVSGGTPLAKAVAQLLISSSPGASASARIRSDQESGSLVSTYGPIGGTGVQ